jgi:adenosylcobinamide-GDP ribazoletransferase
VIRALREAIRGFKGLISLLTIIPVGRSSLVDAASVFYMVPLSGLVEGVLLALPIYILAILDVNALVIGALYVTAHYILTGGIHLDGFADYSDILFSRASGSRAQLILKDPRRGSFAVIAVAINVSLSLATTATLSMILLSLTGLEGFIVLATILCLVYVASAESMFLTLSLAPPEPYEGMARVFSVKASGSRARLLNLIVYTLTLSVLALPLALAVGVEGLTLTLTPLLVVQALVTLFTVWDSTSRLGFANGDVAGFSFELTRILSLTVLAVVLGWYLKL